LNRLYSLGYSGDSKSPMSPRDSKFTPWPTVLIFFKFSVVLNSLMKLFWRGIKEKF
jgi:hypothetical protein